MKIFISWSGQAEQAVAEAMRTALELVCAGRVDVFVSSQDIPKGARGAEVIGTSLSASDYGIVLVSAANQYKPWINYEAGAMARSLDSPVATVLLDLLPSDVELPLGSFQASQFDVDDDMRALFRQIASAADEGIPVGTVEILFDSAWPTVKAAWSPPSDAAADEGKPRRNDSDMLAELVNRMRRIEAKQSQDNNRDARLEAVRRIRDEDEKLSASTPQNWWGELVSVATKHDVDVLKAGRSGAGPISVTLSTSADSLPDEVKRTLVEMSLKYRAPVLVEGATGTSLTVTANPFDADPIEDERPSSA